MTVRVERKLTTILCADVCGYSRLMEQDEEGTLHQLKQARSLFSADIDEYAGRVINMAGDAIIADFPSVVQALQCAVSIQNKMLEGHGKASDPEKLQFRIGLNLGDVIIDGSDIFGDGVNIAARLEGIAPAGGICISGTVYDHVKNKLPLGFQFQGEQKVKNIEGTVEVYSLNLANTPEVKISPNAEKTQKDPIESDPIDPEEVRLRAMVKRQSRFYKRAMGSAAMIVFLFTINMLTSPGYFWFIWPALPILLSLGFSAVRAFGDGHKAQEWEDNRFQKLKKRHHDRSS
jgi:adenylate cyclase